MEVIAIQLFKLQVPKEVDDFLEMLLKSEDLIYAVKSNIINYLILISKNFSEYNIFTVKSDDLKKIYEKLDEKDKFLQNLLKSILTFEYWRIRYFEENKEDYFIVALNNLDKLLKKIELELWILLYLKDKDNALEYKEYIEKLAESVLLSSKIFIPECLE